MGTQNGVVPMEVTPTEWGVASREGKGHSSLGKAKESLKDLKLEVISEQQIDFHGLEHKRLAS